MLREALSDGRPTELVEAEAMALERLDIPYFTALASEVALSAEGSRLIGDYFDAAGEEVVRARFAVGVAGEL